MSAPDTTRARRLFELSMPHVPDLHLYATEAGQHLLVVNGSRLFDVDAEVSGALERARLARDGEAVRRLLESLGVAEPPFVDDTPVEAPPVRALSLAVAQKCNLGCTYCYAQQGDFGGPARNMPLETALEAVDLLLRDASRGERVNLSFLGGEPLFNRAVIRAATERAVEGARAKGVSLTLSLTTNGTLLTPDDGDFLEAHGFAVTVSLDGPQQTHDRLRAFKGGQGSFDKVMANVTPLLERQRRMQVSARVTVTPRNLELRQTLDAFVDLGFHSVGFSPMLASPTGRDELGHAELEQMLEQMVDCGREFERRLVAGRRYPFSNMVNAMRELHKGTHRPYPCGAGAGYLGVSASGELAACHRFVGDEEGAMGDLTTGVDRERQARWLTERHVHRQEPCRSCWARYLCSGGCHHEVIQRGRPACDYIRGWLHYCLEAYSRLSRARPDYFGLPAANG
ncbi:SPASM domain-containing protein [Pyxidicoccus parkwayensis]|uniref:SPASM domain-containing protein n=1 Tax=Pyxidicoccus parkwayensis TaxID=2813578 RepID=A0ABX7P8R3_9BACT|nr:radical SAM protein [Pyxidicoccus parkwaysis]QSQ26842.1 SPASM domain-containing protein [Pyxidicoccus parkwaysis]